MRKVATLALSLFVASSALLVFLSRKGVIGFEPSAPRTEAATTCTTTYLQNQCGDIDVANIVGASDDLAFRGRGMEVRTNFAGVGRSGRDDRLVIYGRRIEGDIHCLTDSRMLIRSTQRELSSGDVVTLSGTIDQRLGRAVLLKDCTFWRG